MTDTHADVHREHRQWLSDFALWRDDLALWQQELDESLEKLTQLESTLREHRQALQSQLDGLAAEEQAAQGHEHVLAQFAQTGSGSELEMLGMAKNHKHHAATHARQRQVHERLKKRHHTLMAHWFLLLRAITQRA